MQVPDFKIDNKQTVAGQMNDLLKSNSPYMQQAATAGKQMAGSRGLLNSSIAAGASQGASIERALPIAQADANTYNAFAGQKYGTQLQGAINSQIQGFTQDNMRLGDTIQRGQNQQMQGFQQDNMRLGDNLQRGQMGLANEIQQTQMRLQDALQKGQMELANRLQSQLNAQQQQFQQANMQLGDTLQRGQNQQLHNFSQQALSQSTTANTQGKYLDAINQITNNAMVSINEIETAEGITQAEKDKMIENTIRRRDADLAFTRNLYSNMPTWDFSWLDTPTGRMPSAPGVS